MAEDIFDDEVIPAKRPTFLTVICILTFIGSAYIIISNTVSYFNADIIAKTVIESKSKMNEDINKNATKDPEANSFRAKVMSNMSGMTNPDNLRKSSLGNIISSIFCLLGAILMWRLNRNGFYLYVLGTIIGIVTPFYVFGNNFLTALSVGFTAFIGVLFVIFYAMNLKSMQRAPVTS